MLSIRQVVKVYAGGVTALSGFDLDIEAGMFGLLGPNGAGKTTLMRIVAGLLAPTAGGVLLDGVDIVAEPSHVWRRLGYLPQQFGMYPHLDGESMLAHLLALKGIGSNGRARLALSRELLAQVNLADAATRKTRTYSGGMMQRLGIAQAIAGNPRLIIVDEPTAGLDPEERLRLYRLLAELAEDRIVLLSTHIVEDVTVLCPRLAVIRKGSLVANTTPTAARRRLEGTVFEAELTAAELARLRGDRGVLREILVEGRHRVRLHAPDGQPPAGFVAVAPTLEDAYLTLMHAEPGLAAPALAGSLR